MPATLVTDKLFSAEPRWAGKIGAAGVASDSATTIPLSAAANLTNGEAYIFTINRVTSDGDRNELAEMETCIGELSGTNFINCERGVEGTASAWSADTVVEILFTAEHWKKLVEWAEVEHNQDGTHSDITADSINLNSGGKIADNTGWIPIEETLTYDSATTITIAAGGNSRYQKGDKLKLTQNTVKYFYIVGVADTKLTITGGTSYTLANAAIESPYLSRVENPFGFPALFSFTPTIALVSGTGTLPTFSVANGYFSLQGGQVFVAFSLNNPSGGTAGSGTGPLKVVLPLTAVSFTTTTANTISYSNGATSGYLFIWGGGDLRQSTFVAATCNTFNDANIRYIQGTVNFWI